MRMRTPLALALLLACCSCASVKFTRDTETSGHFVSSGWAFTILSIDLPRGAMQMARENASDAGLANMQIEGSRVYPDWGWFNWVLDIISVRKGVVRGSWGFTGDQAAAQGASR